MKAKRPYLKPEQRLKLIEQEIAHIQSTPFGERTGKQCRKLHYLRSYKLIVAKRAQERATTESKRTSK